MAENFQTILLKTWREACRHIEIHRSCAAVSQLIQPLFPRMQTAIRIFDPSRRLLETVAVGFADRTLPEGRTLLSRETWEQLQKRLARSPVPADDELEKIGTAILGFRSGEVLLAKLSSLAILVLFALEGVFDSEHRRTVTALLEPFSAALENDRRLRELAALREAAEADKKSLLQKLHRKSLEDVVIGVDGGLARVMERVELVARSDVPVLILGETGTGKELISREIHRRSPRADGPFIRVNCGAIPPELVDSQLFGHEKGSFTGAVSSHLGWFERAHMGTLFLDEIGELAPAAQVRLLRIIQDGWLERVGSQQPIHVDVRLVVATHRDLAEMVRSGLFREDLWYRLSVFPILLPALRERPDDIPALAQHFAERAAIRFSLPPQLPTADDIELLKRYHWPGNIRELGSVIDRAAILGNGAGLEIGKALGFFDGGANSAKEESTVADSAAFPSLDAVMCRHIEAALTRCGGRVEGERGAAKLLNIHPNTLRARMRKQGIRWSDFRE
mgnify:CR=1 FL=1